MIPKKNRFTTQLFDRQFKRSHHLRNGDFIFLVSSAKGQPRFSVVVSKKIAKLSVTRNRLRRQMYEFLRHEIAPHVYQHNLICLYKGKKILEDTQALKEASKKLLHFLKRKNEQ